MSPTLPLDNKIDGPARAPRAGAFLGALALAAFAGGSALAPREACAQAPVTIKPHLLFVLDTSNSMVTGIPNVTTRNSCGTSPFYRNRIREVRCVVTNVLNNVSDAVIGLARFRGTACSRPTDGVAAGGCVLPWTSPDPNCSATNAMTLLYPLIDEVPVAGYPTDRATIIAEELEWFDSTPDDFSYCVVSATNSCNNAGNPDLSLDSATPLGGVLDGARAYFESGLPGSTAGSAVEIDGVDVPSPIATDPRASCRPRAVVLLTDGQETCGGDGPARAAELLNLRVGGVPRPVRTYVIGIGVNAPDTGIEGIARQGGTRASSSNYGFYAQNETELSAAFSQIISDAQLREYCNGADDNCNGQVDEGFNVGAPCAVGVGACHATGTLQCVGGGRSLATSCSAVAGAPVAEAGALVCSDGLDNDCDGLTDCADPDCASTPACSGSCVPTVEVCNGRDDDCDGVVDNGNPGAGTPCGFTLGACRAGSNVCVGGALRCVGAVAPSAEVCNGLDDDCDGVADDGDPGGGAACATGQPGPCGPGTQRCVAGRLQCVAPVGPSAELCNGVDDNCNGTVDEGNPGGGAPCGSNVGSCRRGRLTCSLGALACAGGVGPATELCNGADDDCNGVVDDNLTDVGSTCTPSGATFPVLPPTGVCRLGHLACHPGAGTSCDGAVLPGVEVCNGLDDDCDGMIDEGLDGGPCGSTVGACRAGVLRCVAGRPSCQGSVDPTPELCDGVDNNCDGAVDEGGPGSGAPCGSDVGECRPGVRACRGGALLCEGGVQPAAEQCNALDDDCDGVIDNGVAVGAPCGSSVGACRQGATQCIGGSTVCVGELRPTPEQCNCLDDDCDGVVDNPPSAGVGLCGANAACVGGAYCRCLRPCTPGEFTCPVGMLCQRVEGANRCVPDADPCAVVQCAPTQRCDPTDGQCHSRCEGVSCASPLVCQPSTGRCVRNDCTGLENCPAGQLCHADGACRPNPCAGVSCAPAQACYEGRCGPTCDGVACPQGQRCSRGACAVDRCAGVSCSSGQACEASTGQCAANVCARVACARDLSCSTATGQCADDPCAAVRCPEGSSCAAGSCGQGVLQQPVTRVITSGGALPSCAVGPAPGGGRALRAPLALLLLVLSLARAARRTR